MSAWWKEAVRIAARARAGSALVVALSFASVGLSLALPWPMKLIVDNVLAGKALPDGLPFSHLLNAGSAHTRLIAIALLSVALLASVRLVETARATLAARIGRSMQFDLGGRLFAHLQNLSPLFHARAQAGDLVRRVAIDSKCVDEFFFGICVPAATALVMLIAMFAIMLTISAPIAFLALVMAIPITVLVVRLIPRITEQSLGQQNLEGEMMSLVEANLSALPVVHAFNRLDVEAHRFRHLTWRSLAAVTTTAASERTFGLLVGATIAFGTALAIAVGGFEVQSGRLELGSLLVALTYLALLYAPVETLARLSAAFAHSAAKAGRAFSVLAESQSVTEPAREARPRPLPQRAAGALSFENVSFGYEAGRGAVRNITLSIAAGETVGIVGRAGVGKSTLVSLALRLFDPDEGRVALDGIDIRDWPIEMLRQQFGLVMQQPFLLPVTVEENIAFAQTEFDRAGVVAAARSAGADRFIGRLPRGYCTELGEAARLSGGEKQRLAIARAFYRDAPILILDEPTSALDIETERRLLSAIYGERGRRTTIVIAHRLSTVRDADRIVVLDEGRIAETGTHAELLALRGRYWRLHRLAAGKSPP